jgi:hypothetical protein
LPSSFIGYHIQPLRSDSKVVFGLEAGFWPWAYVEMEGYLDTHDEMRSASDETEKMKFMRNQIEIEIQKGRFSKSFGKNLLRGMYAVPTFAVLKEGSSKLHL